MGIAERREREKEALRTRIVEAARDIVSEQGLDALSMRAIAERIEYSPATLYLYFRDKEELVREVVSEGFRRMGETMREQVAEVEDASDASQQHRAFGRAYARFALENTAYFRVMFELPSVAQMNCPGECAAKEPRGAEPESRHSWRALVDTVQRAMDQGRIQAPSAERGALISWGLIHGLTSLYLAGHLAQSVATHEEFLSVIEDAMQSLRQGLAPRPAPPGR